jgi:hypothetical protein
MTGAQWQGTINMPSYFSFDVSLSFVWGTEAAARDVRNYLPPTLDVIGRIESDRVLAFVKSINKQHENEKATTSSGSRHVVVLSMREPSESKDIKSFDGYFANMLKKRQLNVMKVSKYQHHIRHIYTMALPADEQAPEILTQLPGPGECAR